MQYFNKFNDLTVAVGEDRMTAIPELLRAVPQLDVVILDDAFQHRSVKAGLSILVTEYDQPFWKDHILPLGCLREHPNAAKRSQMVIVSKCPPTIRKEDMQAYKQAVKQYAGHEQVYFTTLDYVAPYNVHTEEKVTLSGYSIILAVGIARPIYLQAYLESKGNKVHALTYRDHHYFTTDDFEEVMQVFQTWSEPNKIVVTTEKDYTRWMPFAQAFKDRGVQLVVQPIEVRFLNNDAPQFNQQIEKYIDEARWAAQSPFQDTNQEVYA
jgi:tetraacyldisaccharide 4'-kinase